VHRPFVLGLLTFVGEQGSLLLGSRSSSCSHWGWGSVRRAGGGIRQYRSPSQVGRVDGMGAPALWRGAARDGRVLPAHRAR
jgi:hypothetical protein